MIQFREIMLTAKHLQKNTFNENAYSRFSILYLAKICISCTKYTFNPLHSDVPFHNNKSLLVITQYKLMRGAEKIMI